MYGVMTTSLISNQPISPRSVSASTEPQCYLAPSIAAMPSSHPTNHSASIPSARVLSSGPPVGRLLPLRTPPIFLVSDRGKRR
jgi:hypothetical protein